MTSSNDSAAIHAVAGMLGSICSTLLTYPLDQMRVHLQLRKKKTKKTATDEISNNSPIAFVQNFIREPSEALLEIIEVKENNTENSRDETRKQAVIARYDPLRLYKGLSSTLFAMSLSMLLYFWLYNKLKKYALKGNTKKQLSEIQNLFVAFFAGVINATVTRPLWNATYLAKVHKEKAPTRKTDAGKNTKNTMPMEEGKIESKVSSTINRTNRAENEEEDLSSITGSIRHLYEKGGIVELFRGLDSAILLCTNPAIQYSVYEQLKQYVIYRMQERKEPVATSSSVVRSPVVLSGFTVFAVGAIAKATATIITYPLQVVQTRQSSEGENPRAMKGVSIPKWLQAFVLLQRITREEGIGTLFRGLSSKLLQTVLNSAFMFLFYEKIYQAILRGHRKLLGRNNT